MLMNIKDFEYRFNLASTHTAKDIQEWCDILSSGKERPLEMKNTISLYDFVSSFNKMYSNFKKDLASLKDYRFGENISLAYYGETYEENKRNALLMLYIDEPDKKLVDDENTFLQIWAKDNEYEAYVTNNINPLDKNSYYNKVNIDKEVMKKYLDFFKKYSSFIEAWENIRTLSIFGNGTSMMFLQADGDIMNELNKITLTFGNYYMNDAETFEIPVLLGDNITIDYDGSVIRDSELEESNKTEIVDDLLKNIYVHNKNISKIYENSEECIFSSSENTINQNETYGYQRVLKK